MKMKLKQLHIGDTPIVVVPLAEWEELQERLEDLEMSASVLLPKKVARARAAKVRHTPAGARKLLGV